jgi:tetratricopeptide (TPR) repeat protein
MPEQYRRPNRDPLRRPEGLSAIPRRVLWTFTLTLPVVILVAVEILLRVLHVGPDLSLFTTGTIAGQRFAVMNPGVALRYFPDGSFSPSTSTDYFSIEKPRGAYRIFCLGGSTTVGFPYGYAGSFPAFLRDRLKALFPDRDIEVINLGLTATNSFTTLDIGRELVGYQPDLLIVYDGHNEFYGALGVASRESISRSRWVTELYLSLLHIRLFVALRDVATWLRSFASSSQESSDGTLMERLSAGKEVPRWSPEYFVARSDFSRNLDALARLASEHNIPIVFGTQVSNLRDLPPFVPGTSSRLPSDLRSDIEDLVHRADSLRRVKRDPEAIAPYDSALTVDSTRADVQFALATTLDSLREYASARAHYVQARDFDELRFRASSDFNDVILALTRSPDVFSLDLEKVFAAHSPDSLIGNALILEHLHPNARGAFLMAKAYAGAMRHAGLLATTDEWARRDTIPDDSLWSRRSLTLLDEIAAAQRIKTLTSRWPFHRRVTLPLPPDPRDSVLGRIAGLMIDGTWTWKQAHEAAAEWYLSVGLASDAAKEYQGVIAQFPHSVPPLLRLADIDLGARRLKEAGSTLQRAFALAPRYDIAKSAGNVFLLGGDYRNAMAMFQHAQGLAEDQKQRQDISRLIDETQRFLNQTPGDERTD